MEPWLHFESGALSNTHGSIMCVYLLDGLEPGDLGNTPLQSFQATKSNKEGTLQLVTQLNQYCENFVEQERLQRQFESCWQPLEKWLEKLPPTDAPKPKFETDFTLKEILEQLGQLKTIVSGLAASQIPRTNYGAQGPSQGAQSSSLSSTPVARASEALLREIEAQMRHEGKTNLSIKYDEN